MKTILILFAILLSVLGCSPDLVAHQKDEEETEIKDSKLPFEPGSRDSIWMEEE